MTTHVLLAATVAMFVVSAPLVTAQSADPSPLAAIKQLKCTFPVYAQGTWRSGAPKADSSSHRRLSLPPAIRVRKFARSNS